jgi:Ca2+-binding RTX toxin-like protein
VLNFDKVTFTLTLGADLLAPAASDGVNDLILAPTVATLQAGDTIDGGTGTDQIGLAAGGIVTDAQFAGVQSVEALWLMAGSAAYTLTLGQQAEASGLLYVNAFDTGANVTVNAGGMTQGLLIDTGAGNNVLTGGVGADTVFATSTLLNAADKLDGGGIAGGNGLYAGMLTGSNDVLSIYDRATLTDAAFGNVRNIEQITIRQGGTALDYIGQKLTLGKLSEAAGVAVVLEQNDYALTVDGSGRSKGLSVFTDAGDDVFIATGGMDRFDAGLGNDSYRVKLASLDANDRYDGGQGSDEIRILDAYDGKNVATKITDVEFSGVTSVERLVFDATGKQDVTLGTYADAAGLELVDGSKVTSGLRLDATGMTQGLAVIAGSGTDTILLGDSGQRDIYIKSGALTSADVIDGGSQAGSSSALADPAVTTLHFTDAVKLGETSFGGWNLTVSGISVLDFDNAAAGQSLVAGAKFAGFVTESGIVEINAAAGATAGFSFNFAAYAGPSLTVNGTGGNDSFIGGAADLTLRGGGGDDAFSFKIADLGGSISGGSGTDRLVLLDAGTLGDGDWASLNGIETVVLAAKSGDYDLMLGATAQVAGITTVDASGATGSVAVTIGNAGNLTVIAGSGKNAVTGGEGANTVAIDTKTLNNADVFAGGGGTDTLKLLTAGTVTAAALQGLSGVEVLQLSQAGNSIVLSDAVIANGLDAVLGGKGNDIIDLSALTGTAGLTLAAGGGNDTVIGSAGGDRVQFTLSGELNGADKIDLGGGDDRVVVLGGTFSSDQFKGFKNVEGIEIDNASGQGSTVVLKNDFFANATADPHLAGYRQFTIDLVGAEQSGNRVDATAVTGMLNGIVVNAGDGVDALLGGAGRDVFSFGLTGDGGFQLTAEDRVDGGANLNTLQLLNFDGPASLADADLRGASNVESIAVWGDNDITLGLGAEAARAGIQEVHADGYDQAGNLSYFAGGLTLDAHAYADGTFVATGLTVVAGSGIDSLTLTRADDTVRFLENDQLTAGDTIAAAQGEDRVEFYGAGDITDAQFGGVSDLEIVALRGDAHKITLGGYAEDGGVRAVDASAANQGVVIDLGVMEAGLNIHGSAFDDTITGSSGDDTIIGGSGADMLTGGGGDDTFVFSSLGDSQLGFSGDVLPRMDTITDFSSGDSIDLSAFGFDFSTGKSLTIGSFLDEDTSGWFGANGVVIVYDSDSDSTRLYADVDHDGSFELNRDLVITFTAFDEGGGDFRNLIDNGIIFTGGTTLHPVNDDPTAAGANGTAYLLTKGGTYQDGDLTLAFGADYLQLAASKTAYTLSLGVVSEGIGVSYVDAGAVSAAVTIDASLRTMPVYIKAGSGANTLTGSFGDDIFYFTSAGLSATDTVKGGAIFPGIDPAKSLDFDTIFITDKAAVVDAAFKNVRNVEQLEVGVAGTAADIAGQSVILGALSEAAGINVVRNDYEIGLTVDGSARSRGLEVIGRSGNDIFVGTKGDDNFDAGGGDDSYRVKLANLNAGDRFEGGLGSDEIRILDSWDGKSSGLTVVDADFTGFTSVERLVFDGTGKQNATLGAAADNAGLSAVDAGKTTGGLVLDAGAMHNALQVTLGSGADTVTLGDATAGILENQIFVKSTNLNAADKIDGTRGVDSLHLTDSVKLADAWFSGLGNVTGIDRLAFDSTAAGQSAVFGSAFSAWLTANQGSILADDGFSIAGSRGAAGAGISFDFSGLAYTGPVSLTAIGSSGSDVFTAGKTDMTFLGSAGGSNDLGKSDTFRFASGYFDGEDTVAGGTGLNDRLVILDSQNAIIDADFIGVTGVEILTLGATKGGAYFVQLAEHANSSGILAVDASAAGVAVNIDASDFDRGATVLAGGQANTITGSGYDDVVAIDTKTLNGSDQIDGGSVNSEGGSGDTLQLTTGGAVAAGAFAQVTDIEVLQLSDFGNSVTLTNDLVDGASDYAELPNWGWFDFLVLGGKGNDKIDISQVDAESYVGVVAGAGADTLIGNAADNVFLFMNPGDLGASDKLDGGSGFDDVAVDAGTYSSDQFKGFQNIEELYVFDADGAGSATRIVIKNDFMTSNAVAATDGFGKVFSIWIDQSLETNDVIDASGVTGALNALQIFSGSGNDRIIGGAGNDLIRFDDDGSGGGSFFLLDSETAGFELTAADTVVGGLGRDTIQLNAFNSDATLLDADLAGVSQVEVLQVVSGNGEWNPSISLELGLYSEKAGIGEVDGSGMAGNLTIDATERHDALDVVLGLAWDTIDLGAGDDRIIVRGNATFDSHDEIHGGAGTNTLQFESDWTLVDDDLAGVHEVEQIRLDGAVYEIHLGENADAAGITTIDATRSISASIDAHEMTNSLLVLGGKGDDAIEGGSAGDVILGNAGADTLTGHGGGDQFVIASASDSVLNHMDVITDFNNTSEGDLLDFTGLGLVDNVQTGTVGSFGAGGPQTSFGAAGGIVVETDGTVTRVYADTNHDGVFSANADTVVQLTGDHLSEFTGAHAGLLLQAIAG